MSYKYTVPSQLELTARRPHPAHPGWGGPRPGAGRPRSKRGRVPHARRPKHTAYHPVHITLRIEAALAPLRTKTKLQALRASIRGTHEAHAGLRIVHFSLQNTHLHLIVEATDGAMLSSGLRGLEVRIARRLNQLARRRGRVFNDRWHSHSLRTPREVRRALAYVLLNHRHHGPQRGPAWLDPCSSATAFDGWSRPASLPPGPPQESPPVRPPVSWLLRIGWRRHGLIPPDFTPG